MCGRYVSPTQAEMERYWRLTDAQRRNPLAQRLNVSPTAIVPILGMGDDGGLEEVAAPWSLIPFWWKEAKPPRLTFNARNEEPATNSKALSAFRHYVTDLWRRTLRRRSQKDAMTWARITKIADAWLPKPRILHPWPDQRFAVTHPRWEPSA